MGPEMVFTHRSKAGTSEKWTRTFNDSQVFDSLKFSYIDPKTNVKETITIPETGGLKTETYDSKGIRNYKQAFWAANRRHQKNILKKISVSFSATEEGIFALPNRAVSVVKGSRMATYDGYATAVNGLTIELSQPVKFTSGGSPFFGSEVTRRRSPKVFVLSLVRMTRQVIMTSVPQAIYTGTRALKTEFSFGNEARHNAQMILVSTVDPGDDRTVKITGFNYDKDFYKFDNVPPFGRAFSNGFDNGFNSEDSHMSSGCGDVMSLNDLQIAKKHQIFEAEVITGKQGGVAGGADIDYATNPVTGQTQKTLSRSLTWCWFLPRHLLILRPGVLSA
uniref:38 kDa minor structural protein n=1 Tax=Salmonella phage MB78 TaxID=52971 RepID=Q8H9Y4_9CAUD|nr:38 kDa minor structural protein [Salmonella phage MB78]